MKLSELTASYRPVYPQPYKWDATVAYLTGDPIEADIVNELVTELRERGRLREPVCLSVGSFDDGDRPAVTDGTHRVVAHILSGVEEVYVEVYEDEEDPEEEEELVETIEAESEQDGYSWLETVVIFDGPLSEVDGDKVFSIMRSLKVSDELWFTSSIGTSNDERYTTIWDVYEEDVETFPEELKQRVTDLITSKLVHYGVGRIVSVVTRVDRWEPGNS